jgi:hypothetical protein
VCTTVHLRVCLISYCRNELELNNEIGSGQCCELELTFIKMFDEICRLVCEINAALCVVYASVDSLCVIV